MNSVAPKAIITQFYYALLMGIIIVFPFLIYLIYLFKKIQGMLFNLSADKSNKNFQIFITKGSKKSPIFETSGLII